MKLLYFFLVIVGFLVNTSNAQLIIKDNEGTPNVLLKVNDEGTAGSITLNPVASIESHLNKLYAIGINLYWNGFLLGTSVNAGGWTDGGASIYNTTITDKIGIGTTNPQSFLSVGGSGIISATIYGTNSENLGRGIYGVASNTGSVENYGGFFEAKGIAGIGVLGEGSSNGNDINYGGFFRSNGTIGRGVYGISTYNGSGTNYGGYFKSNSVSGRGVYGEALNNNGNYNTGGYFIADGNLGTGVYGKASNTGNVENYGGYFEALGSAGIGVVGKGALDGYGGFFDGKIKIKHNSSSTNPQLILEEEGITDYARINFNNSDQNYFWTIAAFNSSTNSSERFNIFNNTSGDVITATGDGKVGIMTINPNYTLEVNGTAGKPGGGSWSVASDIRLKKDIEEFTDGLDVVSRIHTISFSYSGKAGYPMGKRYIGIIAQEMVEIAPYMISETKANDGVAYLQFDPSAMDFITVNAIQEQQKIITIQESKIIELEERLSNLENIIKSNR